MNKEYLYHYTSVSSLAMILKSKNIRFSPLSVLDDKEEQMHNYSKYVFVSSWTDDELESIPMWKMYSSPTEGVRIKLPKYPFYNYRNTASDFSKLGFCKEDGCFNMIIQPDEFINPDYLLLTYAQENILTW